jgi:hypothetical protein
MNIAKDSSFSLTQNYSLRKIISENFSISKSNITCAEAAKVL